MRVLVTCPPMLRLIDEFHPRFSERNVALDAPAIVQTMSEDDLIARLKEYDGWIAGDDPASAPVLEAAVQGRLKVLVKWGVGVDNVDFAAAKRLGLKTAHTPFVFGREVADIAMGYVIGLARETYAIDREIRERNGWPKPSGISLAGKQVALVGYGDIGRNIARRLVASDMEVTAYDPVLTEPDGTVQVGAWPQGVERADFLVLACPLNAQTRHMVNEETLAAAKPGIRIVNVARGPVIDESALIAALQSGHVHSAALDVFEVEPLPADSPLRGFPKCILGSHNASNTRDAVVRVSHTAIDKLFDMLGVAV